MKILCISDHIDPLVYSYHINKRFSDISFVISCGDLRMHYYDFIVSNLNKPLYFVFGNHHLNELPFYDTRSQKYPNAYHSHFPKFSGVGATYIECISVKSNNLLLMGLGGSRRYNNGENQFTECEMFFKILSVIPRLLFNKIRYGRYLDILITHAPPFDIHDEDDPCHRGFKVFRWFLKVFRPKYMIHGHIHLYSKNENRIDKYLDTQVVNAYDHYILDIEGKT